MWISHETDYEDRLSESIARVVAMSVMDAAVAAGLTGGTGVVGCDDNVDNDDNSGCGSNFGEAGGELGELKFRRKNAASLVEDGWICESESMDVIGNDENENENDDKDEYFLNSSSNSSSIGVPKKPIIDHSENIGFLLDSIKMLGKIVLFILILKHAHIHLHTMLWICIICVSKYLTISLLFISKCFI